MNRQLRLAMVAGEASGDSLGARVLQALADTGASISPVGIGGSSMRAQGLRSEAPMETLSVMGLVEPLARLPQLLRLRAHLRDLFLSDPPDLFLGIDAPDFNLPLAATLRGAGIPTAQLVSPSVWAWRRGRLRSIGRAVDRVFCLFPFETGIYEAHGIDAQFVGHPLADELAPEAATGPARKRLGLPAEGTLLALLPGSRGSEVRFLGERFLQVAERAWREGLAQRFVLPLASDACRRALQPALSRAGTLPLELIEGHSRDAIAAADAVLTASGTATLEAALLRKPMVVAYRTGALNWLLLSRLVDTPYVALPNILSGREVVPEYLQGDATVEALYAGVVDALQSDPAALHEAFDAIHGSLRCDFAARTARGMLDLVQRTGRSGE